MTTATVLIAVVPVEQIGKRRMHPTELDELNRSAVQVVVHNCLGRFDSGCNCSSSGNFGGGCQSNGNVDTPHFRAQRRQVRDFVHDEVMNRLQTSSIAAVRQKSLLLRLQIGRGRVELSPRIGCCKSWGALHQKVNHTLAEVPAIDGCVQEEVPQVARVTSTHIQLTHAIVASRRLQSRAGSIQRRRRSSSKSWSSRSWSSRSWRRGNSRSANVHSRRKSKDPTRAHLGVGLSGR